MDLQKIEKLFSLKCFLVLWQDFLPLWAATLYHQINHSQLNVTKMKNSHEFMLLFRFEPNFNFQPTAEEEALMQQQWGAYIGGLAIQEKLIGTHQLGFEGVTVLADQSVNSGILIAENQALGGNMIVKAINIQEAVEIAKGCPILSMGGNVEVRSILEM